MNEESLETIISGVISELVGYEIAIIESSNLPFEDRLVRVVELLDDIENAVIAASMQLTGADEESIAPPLIEEDEHVECVF